MKKSTAKLAAYHSYKTARTWLLKLMPSIVTISYADKHIIPNSMRDESILEEAEELVQAFLAGNLKGVIEELGDVSLLVQVYLYRRAMHRQVPWILGPLASKSARKWEGRLVALRQVCVWLDAEFDIDHTRYGSNWTKVRKMEAFKNLALLRSRSN